MKTIFQNEIINAIANELLSAGFTLIVPEKNDYWNYFHFSLNDQLGYCQLDRFKDRVRFSTVHKPCKECGTGYGLQAEFEGLTAPTIEDAKEAFIKAPQWAHWKDAKQVIKYNSLADYLAYKDKTSSKYTPY